ncbi:hypothetical protein G5V59_11325 [Nocardioides sp. W3-2-3]|uniref:hypothetical protein n=1 Tax=Nocardioides convexus TaxID=2712224 RepID=UPI002418431D|nr:hypothetical protein [Nocardioides convexus]NHA00447.1 hypothetical protein [Nocardioides convexus]
MTTVLLATYDLMPDGEPGGDLLVEAFAERGVDARWARWDDPSVDWAGADLVAARSVWDYHRRLPEFLAWASRVEATTPLLNGAEVFGWNADKIYLAETRGRRAHGPDGAPRRHRAGPRPARRPGAVGERGDQAAHRRRRQRARRGGEPSPTTGSRAWPVGPGSSSRSWRRCARSGSPRSTSSAAPR